MKTLFLLLLPSLFMFGQIQIADGEKSDHRIVKTDLSKNLDDWGPMYRSDCYTGIVYKTKCNKSYCSIQFQNIYKNLGCANFSWEIWEDRAMTKAISTGNRVSCLGYMETTELNYVPKDINAGVWIIVKKLRFGKEDTGPYESCDR